MRVPTNAATETRVRWVRWVRWLGFLVGILATAAVVFAGRIPAGDGRASADVLFLAGPTGELAVAPTGLVLAATGLRPGIAAHGGMAVTNQTGKRLNVALRALPESRDLDELLRVRIRIGRANVFAGSLGDMRSGKTTFALGSGKTARLKLSAWLPRSARLRNAGRVVSVPLELKTSVAT